VAETEPERKHLVNLMTGLEVIVQHMKGPSITEENFDQVVNQREPLTGQPEASTGVFYLRSYSNYGIEVSKERDSRPAVFMPWGSILAIYTTHTRDELVQFLKEDLAREGTEQTEESNPT
jgi:hypothetical protein